MDVAKAGGGIGEPEQSGNVSCKWYFSCQVDPTKRIADVDDENVSLKKAISNVIANNQIGLTEIS